MKNYTIFALHQTIKDSLYTVVYEDSFDKYENNEYQESDCEKKDEITRVFQNWGDMEYLEAFFEDNKSDLQKEFYNHLSIEDAIQITTSEAAKLEETLLEIAKKGETNRYENLQTLFKPLHKKEESKWPIPDYQESKVYGDRFKSWLRIYAIRIDTNLFVITGGAIKLTENMNEREHLLIELEKLDVVKKHLKNNGIEDIETLVGYLEI